MDEQREYFIMDNGRKVSKMSETRNIFIQVIEKPAANEYVQGVEVEADYNGVVPEGFEVIDLPAAKYLLFRGEHFTMRS